MLRRNRTFAKMFAAYGLSAFGDYFDWMALSILLGFVWRADATTIALVPLAFAAPAMALGPWAGALADRHNRRDLMAAADLARALLTAALLFAPNAGALLALVALRAAARAFHYPAQQAMTRSVVGPEELLRATSLNGAAFQLSKVLSPLLGASVAAAFSPAFCLAGNAVCYAVSALLLLSVPKAQGRAPADGPTAHAAAGDPPRRRSPWRDGWRLMLGSRTLLASVAFSLIGLAGIQLIDAQLAVLLRDAAPRRPELLGWIVAAIGGGGLAGVAWLRRYKRLAAYGRLLGGGVALIGAMFAALGAIRPGTPLWLPLAASFAGGVGTGLTSTCMTYILQKETPSGAIGRVSGLLDSMSGAVFVVAPLIGGALIVRFGASATFLVVGTAVALIGVLGVAMQRIWWGTRAPAAAKRSVEI